MERYRDGASCQLEIPRKENMECLLYLGLQSAPKRDKLRLFSMVLRGHFSFHGSICSEELWPGATEPFHSGKTSYAHNVYKAVASD